MSVFNREALQRGFDYKGVEAASKLLESRSVDAADLFTVPTGISASGLALVIKGSRRLDTLAGVNMVAAGRSFDLFDGFFARLLEQESDIGAGVDTLADKIGMAAIIYGSWQARTVPQPVLATAAISNGVNAGLSATAILRHPEKRFRPPANGKHSMAALNASLLSFNYAHVLERKHPEYGLHEPLIALAWSTFALGSTLAASSAGAYASRIR